MAGGAANPGLFAQAVAEDDERRRRYGQFTGAAPVPGTPGATMLQTANGGNYLFGPGTSAESIAQQQFGPPPPPPPPQANQIYGTREGGSIALKEGGDLGNPAHFVQTVPGRAATKGGLTLRTQTERGGYEIDPERQAEIDESQARLQAAREEGFQRTQEAMAERSGQMQAVRNQLSNEAAVQAHENAVKEQRLGDMRARYEAAEADFLATPERQKTEREGNKGKTVIETISQALGALGASLARTPNFAAQVIAANREREMRQEEVELRVKKEGRDSLLGRLRDDLGSMDLARTAYRTIKARESALALEASAMKIADEQTKTQMLTMAGQENQKYLQGKQALEIGAKGEVTKSLVNTPSSAGSKARQVGITPEQHAQILENKGKAASIAKTEAETGKTRAELAGGGAGGKLSDTAANSLSNIRAAKELLINVAEKSRAAGYKIAPEGDVAGVSLQSQANIEHREAANSLLTIAAKAVEGDAASETHVKRLGQAMQSGNPATRRAAETELMRTLVTKEKEFQKVVPGASGR